MSRRQALVLGLTAFSGLGIGYLARTPEAGRLYLQNELLKRKTIAYGGGVSLLGPFQGANGKAVSLRLVFSFGSDYVVCTVEDNPEGFVFPTATLGNVSLDPHSFFMYMGGSKVKSVEYSADPNGVVSAVISGGLACHTQAITASGTYGGRDSSEPATFQATARDGTDFSIAVNFDKTTAPVNSAIFGPKFTFKGLIADAVIVVKQAQDLGQSSG
jgi:hypothetical protein